MAAAALLLAHASWGAVYYASLDGDDANTGLGPEPGTALRTIRAGVNKLHAGDTLLIRAGAYRETVVVANSGTSDRPVTVKAYEGEEVTVSGCDPVTGWARGEGDKSCRLPGSFALPCGELPALHLHPRRHPAKAPAPASVGRERTAPMPPAQAPNPTQSSSSDRPS